MPDYDFRLLSAYDFELLVRDLLQAELKVRVESFKAGKDKGIDLRHAASRDGGFIAQCKHYAGSGFAKLAAHLAASEKPKIVRLAPARYVLATSVPLSAGNKDGLLRTLTPYCKGPNDILGKEDLNNLLGRHPDVERLHFKLWLSSSVVLDRLLNSKIYAQTELALDVIKEKMCRYVQNESYAEATRILEDLHYCIICGMPGIGKTMLADMLLVSAIGRGYEAIKITGSVDEALAVFKKGKRQVFYYDDFLGQTSLQQQKLAKNEDQQLLLLIDRVRQSEHHRFLLTTREYILAQAKAHYERLETSRFDVRRCAITLDKYTQRNRCKILYNHLYFSKLPQEYVDALIASGAHREIVKHKNFSPRIVEWMTTILQELPPAADYGKEFLSNLDHPQRLWEHAYSRQLSTSAQTLLLVIGTMSREAFFEDADRAFSSVWSAGSGGPLAGLGGPPFVSALRELDGTFVKSVKDAKNRIVLSFQSPSIQDFVEYTLRLNGAAARTILARAVFFEQVRRLDDVMRASPAMKDEFIGEWGEALVRTTLRTMDQPDCTLWQVRKPNGSIELEHAQLSREARVAFTLGALPSGPQPEANLLLSGLETRWQNTQVTPAAVEGLLEAIRDTAHLSPERKSELADKCSAALLQAEPDLEKFKAIGALRSGGLLPPSAEAGLEEVREEFLGELEWFLNVSDYADYSSAVDGIEEVESVAQALGIDITGDVEAAKDEARSIREPDYDDLDEPPPPRTPEAGPEVLSDADIDEIFSGLEKV